MANEGTITAFLQGIMEISSTKKHPLGTLRILGDGRKFRYAKAGSSALGAGKMGIAVGAEANHTNQVCPATSVGSTVIQFTVGATAVVADEYADGYFQINDEAGEGHQYKIKSNTACDASGTTTIKLADPIKVALTTSSQATLVSSPWYAVTESTTEESLPVGVAPCAVTASYYYWAQTGGPAICLCDQANAVGTMLTLDATAGALTGINATLDIDQPICAIAWFTAGVTGEYKPVKLMLD